MMQQEHFRSSALVLILLLFFASVSGQAAQDTARLRVLRGSVVVVPADYGCYPVEVKGIYLSGEPLHVVLGEVDIKNESDKRATAVQLAWMLQPIPAGANYLPKCGIPPAAQVVLNGKTPLISLGYLEPKETCHIGPNPLLFKSKALKTVFVDFPIIDANDLMSLDIGSGGLKYVIALYVSEIHYGDGTTWTFER